MVRVEVEHLLLQRLIWWQCACEAAADSKCRFMFCSVLFYSIGSLPSKCFKIWNFQMWNPHIIYIQCSAVVIIEWDTHYYVWAFEWLISNQLCKVVSTKYWPHAYMLPGIVKWTTNMSRVSVIWDQAFKNRNCVSKYFCCTLFASDLNCEGDRETGLIENVWMDQTNLTKHKHSCKWGKHLTIDVSSCTITQSMPKFWG